MPGFYSGISFLVLAIGVYAVFKIATLIAATDRLDPLAHPGSATALTIELVAGLAVPFVMLLFRAVRRSPGWLFFSAMLVVLGVVLNRINVFLVGFHPQTAGPAYFPSIGEFAVTTSVIALLVLLWAIIQRRQTFCARIQSPL